MQICRKRECLFR